MTLEDVFVRKLRDDPSHILELSREYLAQWQGEQSFIRSLIDKHVLSWLELDDDNEELGRRVLGLELMNLLRPI